MQVNKDEQHPIETLVVYEDMMEMLERREIDPFKIWFSDEAHFHLQGYVNKQNWCHWGIVKISM